MTRKRKKRSAPPKVRHTWEIRPETRIKPSGKIYRRPSGKKPDRAWVDEVDWFGERKKET